MLFVTSDLCKPWRGLKDVKSQKTRPWGEIHHAGKERLMQNNRFSKAANCAGGSGGTPVIGQGRSPETGFALPGKGEPGKGWNQLMVGAKQPDHQQGIRN